MHTEDVDVTFEPLRAGDLPLLAAWLARPHVRRWWRHPSDVASVGAEFGPLLDGSDPTEGFIVHLGGRPIGYLQRELIEDDDETQQAVRTALGDAGGVGIDYFIGEPDLVGTGIGRAMIARFADGCFARYPSESRIVVCIEQSNVASWKALEAAGFRRAWAGDLDSTDPSDEGPSVVYVLARGAP